MIRTGVFFAVVAFASGAAGDSGKKARQLEPSEMALFHDGKGHYLLYPEKVFRDARPTNKEPGNGNLVAYYGTRRKLHQFPVHPRYGHKDSDGYRHFHMYYKDPRANYSLIERHQRKVTVVCDKRRRSLMRVPDREARKIIARAKLAPRLWSREVLFLGRDPNGVYYYADRHKSDKRRYDSHLYIGRRGSMKRVKLRDVVRDSAGWAWFSRRGRLEWHGKGIPGQGRASFTTRKGKKLELRVLRPAGSDRRLVHNQLGVYLGKRFGLPCDD